MEGRRDGEWRKNEGPTTTKGERRKWVGGREGKRKGFAGPMSNCFLRPDVLRILSTTVGTTSHHWDHNYVLVNVAVFLK